MSTQLVKLRRNIHTYPFKYKYVPPPEFFKKELASIYIHIPFCSTKCHFCDYTVYTHKSDEVKDAYVQRLGEEIRRFAADRAFPGYRIDAIYFGGGTPGSLSGEQLARVLKVVQDNYELTPTCEICIEFDPKSVTLEKLQILAQAGVNRISLGVQTFNEELLRAANRPHDLASIYAAFEAIAQVGFTHTNLDLIYPLPGLNHEIWQDSVEKALALETSCVTVYGLEIWPGTAYHNWLHKGKLALPSADDEVQMYTYAIDRLEQLGYVPRSNSGYYHPDKVATYCRFLEFYWRTWPMIGFGVSSKSVVGSHLWTNVKPLKDYMERVDSGQSVMDFGTQISKPQEMRRVMIRGLKMTDVNKADFYARFGVEMEVVFSQEIAELVAEGMLLNEPERIVLTKMGRTYGTNVYEKFYTNDDVRPPRSDEVEFGISQLISMD
jgi:oxygen-independent coproporphyrinogen-3 oxidase